MSTNEDFDDTQGTELMMIGGRPCELHVMQENDWWMDNARRDVPHQSNEGNKSGGTQGTNQSLYNRKIIVTSQSEVNEEQYCEEVANRMGVSQFRDEAPVIQCKV